MKITYRRLIIFAVLIVISIGFGFAFDAIATAIEKHNHPIEERYANEISKNAEEFGIPEAILWATVQAESDFVSNYVSEDGKIGLMQLTSERFTYICTEILGEPAKDSGMLYEPATNLRAGSALISELFQRYGVWETVYAAYFIGEETVDTWLANPDLVSEQGRLQNIPDEATAKYIEQMTKSVKLYQKLYFNS